MREILFRGKRVDNGERVYGAYYKQEEWYGDKQEEHNIITSKEALSFDQALEFSVVIPETIGQYTGLTDKNGKKIFEDDIVKVTNDNGETDLCSCGIGDVCFYDGVWYIGGEVNDGLYDVNKIYYVEIIGNIHDNSELLGGVQE